MRKTTESVRPVAARSTMLIVDDYADARLLLSPRLKKHGYDTVFAADALQAIAAARQAQPDAVILDLGSPGGNGLLMWDRLKRNIAHRTKGRRLHGA